MCNISFMKKYVIMIAIKKLLQKKKHILSIRLSFIMSDSILQFLEANPI